MLLVLCFSHPALFAMNSESRYPTVRMRRLRYHPAVRALLVRNRLHPANLILPLFVRSGEGIRKPITSMPGQQQLSVDTLVEQAKECQQLGLGGIILFGIPEAKDERGSEALSDNGIVQQALRAVKSAVPELLVISDICFCEYTDHGHCGLLDDHSGHPDVNNDATLALLAEQAISHAQAGADMVAPSGMMDGMVGAIRQRLDASGFENLPIMSYAAKYASSFYGPFREAADCTPQFGDRRSYQMDPAAAAEQAVREVELDLAEGADIIMVKPALAYLDILCRLQQQFPGVPLAAYNVSGEYSMVQAAAEKGWLDAEAVSHESLLSIHRAGASMILTYWALDVARWYRAEQS